MVLFKQRKIDRKRVDPIIYGIESVTKNCLDEYHQFQMSLTLSVYKLGSIQEEMWSPFAGSEMVALAKLWQIVATKFLFQEYYFPHHRTEWRHRGRNFKKFGIFAIFRCTIKNFFYLLCNCNCLDGEDFKGNLPK